jgi:hypothetical protein
VLGGEGGIGTMKIYWAVENGKGKLVLRAIGETRRKAIFNLTYGAANDIKFFDRYYALHGYVLCKYIIQKAKP